MNFARFPPEFIICQVIVLFFGIGLHEYAHCKFADLAGDPTPRYFGRVTLNLTKHFEASGVIFMVISMASGFGLGWGKPAPMDSSKMRNPRLDLFIAVIAGPLSNVTPGLVIYAVAFRLLMSSGARYDDPYFGHPDIMVRLCSIGILTNLGLALFNMIPFGPLDGHWLLGLLLPEKPRYYWFRFNRTVGSIGLIAVILIMQTMNFSLLGGPILKLYILLTGLHPVVQ